MTDFTYWGRSETGKVRLSDDRVEQLYTARARRSERLSGEMQATLDVDPITGDRQEVSHFYFTAVPTRGWPDMFSRYTSDPQSRMRLLERCGNLANDIGRADRDQRPTTIAYAALRTHRRTQRVAAGWVQTWPGKPSEGPGYRTVGVDDDGPIRYINLGAGSAHSIDPDTKLVHEVQLLHETRDMIRLVTALSDDVGYVGSWLLGVQLNRLSGHVSQLADPFVSGRQAPAVPFDAPGYSASTQASALELRDKPEAITGRLMRKLLRGLGTEWLLSQPPFD